METKILVVDDYAYNRLIYREWLEELAGVEIVEAATPRRALQLAAQDPYALFVVDVEMPEIDGVELTARLRRLPGCRTTPVIVVTTQPAEPRVVTSAYAAGAADFLASAAACGSVLQQKAAVFVELFQRRQALAAKVQDLQERLEESARKHDELRTQATHDALTRLPNRVLFRDRLQAACARASRNRALFGVAYLDLDGFKAINDAHGHAVGDALIAAIGARLAQAVRASDTVARLGGDEFGLLLEGIDSAHTGERVAAKIHRLLVQPYELKAPGGGDKLTVALGCSVGLALYPEHATELDRLVFRADMAMYAAKEDGGGVRLYGDDLLGLPAATDTAFQRPDAAARLERH